MFIFAQHKLATEKPLLEEDYKYSPRLYEKQVETIAKLETSVAGFVELLKAMA